MTFHLLHVKNLPIYEQLQIEEALLRGDDRNYCIINEGSSPAIVLGISGKLEELVNQQKWRQNPIPLIRRFSGGGTVVVDEGTVFVSFICQKEMHLFPIYPERIMKWTEEFYSAALQIEGFHLRENDYVIGEKKCGGNAQYLRKERWVHHTTFLWNYCSEKMNLLLHPKKTPFYRTGRSHQEFLCTLSDYLPSKEKFVREISDELSRRYQTYPIVLEEIAPLLMHSHRRSTIPIDF